MHITIDDLKEILIALIVVARVIVKATETKVDDKFYTEKVLPVLKWLGLVVGEKNPVIKEEK